MAISAKLDELGFDYKLRPDNIFYVADKTTAMRAKNALFQNNLVPYGTDPWSFFDVERWTTTDFERNVNLQRAITKQLEQHILALDDVDNVNVTLVVPQDELFAEDQKPITASVIVTPKPGADLTTNRKKLEGIVAPDQVRRGGPDRREHRHHRPERGDAERLHGPRRRGPAGARQARAEGQAGAGGALYRADHGRAGGHLQRRQGADHPHRHRPRHEQEELHGRGVHPDHHEAGQPQDALRRERAGPCHPPLHAEHRGALPGHGLQSRGSPGAGRADPAGVQGPVEPRGQVRQDLRDA